jgi:hypothetical protein
LKADIGGIVDSQLSARTNVIFDVFAKDLVLVARLRLDRGRLLAAVVVKVANPSSGPV